MHVPSQKSLESAFTFPQAAAAQPAACCRPLRIQVESRSPRCAPVIFLHPKCYYLNSCLRMSIGGLKAFSTARTDYRACGPAAAGRTPPVQRPPHCAAGAPAECAPHQAARPAAQRPGRCGGPRQNDGRWQAAFNGAAGYAFFLSRSRAGSGKNKATISHRNRHRHNAGTSTVQARPAKHNPSQVRQSVSFNPML